MLVNVKPRSAPSTLFACSRALRPRVPRGRRAL